MGLKIDDDTVFENGVFKKKTKKVLSASSAGSVENNTNEPKAKEVAQAPNKPEVKEKPSAGSRVKPKKKSPTQGKKTPASEK